MKCGLELHVQVNGSKLFCRCPSIEDVKSEPDYVIKRKLHAVKGESGKTDYAAKKEAEKNRIIKYNCYNENTCLVDIDEEPPREIDEYSLKTGIEIAILLNMKPVDELQIMRKVIIDGSAVSGFQRTGLLATNGWIDTSQGRVKIATLCIEEDSAKRIDDNTFSLERLGIPLIEIATEPDIKSAFHAREVAEKIGMLCKFTGKIAKGIGSIRQDVNVSVPNGARVEIKGVQDLAMMPKFVECEVMRQENLLKIKDELNKKKVSLGNWKDVSIAFLGTKCDFLKNQKIYGFKLINAKGILGYKIQKEKSFGKEIAEHLKAELSINGILHKDELPNYGISIEETRKAEKLLGCLEKDNFILIACNDEKIVSAQKLLNEVLNKSKKGIIEEVRAPNHSDGTNSYMRPLPSSKRMYPETDVPAIRILGEMISNIISNLSKTPEEKYAWLKSTGLNDELCSQLIKSNKLRIYELILEKTNANNSTVASILMMNPAEKLSDDYLVLLFKLLEENELCKESIPLIIEGVIKKENINDLIKKYRQLSQKELKLKIRDIINNSKGLEEFNAFGIIMKKALDELRGKADAGLISKIAKELMDNDKSKRE
ncbi:MAG: Glu-tRNA(Gln) amidotransferase subunit GatE [Candidatus Nanoarchaeia archaeon]|nr:Glu-tRNA(Gln) amidotransferase subunit GatE [Candidatus Nanoarchaeia archaeon]